MIYKIILIYIFAYPLLMSVVWSVGGLYYWYKNEKNFNNNKKDKKIKIFPPVTILIPCHNEEKIISTTCENMKCLNYSDYQVIFIDDCSEDKTIDIIRKHVRITPNYYLIALNQNCGKAQALNIALNIVETPIVIVVDGDTFLEKDSLREFVIPFMHDSKLGAVTGNPFVKKRDGFWSKFQAVEFSAIIGLIKRSQNLIGGLFTISGCATAFKTEALKKVEGFSSLTATEDIDITWRLQKKLFRIEFVPKALALIEAPTKLSEIWRQRLRWALGGWHFFRTHRDVLLKFNMKNLWPIFFEFVLGIIWSICFTAGTVLWLLNLPFGLSVFPTWPGAVISVMCVIQMLISIVVNYQYDKKLWKCFFWMPWYPLVFFMLMAFAIVIKFPEGLWGKLDKNTGIWKSPKR